MYTGKLNKKPSELFVGTAILVERRNVGEIESSLCLVETKPTVGLNFRIVDDNLKKGNWSFTRRGQLTT